MKPTYAELEARVTELEQDLQSMTDARDTYVQGFQEQNALHSKFARQAEVAEAKVKALEEALRAEHKELRILMIDQPCCDHAAGVCYCETYKALDMAKQALSPAGTQEKEGQS